MKLLKLSFVVISLIMTTLCYSQFSSNLSFDASEENSLVECGVLSEDLSNFTVETRVSFSSLASGNYLVCNEGWGDAAEGFVLRVSDNKPSFTMGVASGWKDVKGTTTLEIDKWYHIAVSFDGTDLKLYVDGLLESTSQPGEMLNQSGQSLVLGEGAAWKGRRLNGELSDVRIWNTARTLQEIADNKDAYLTSVPSGLIANWQMSEGSGSSLSDFVGNYNTTIGSGVVWKRIIDYKTSYIDFGPDDVTNGNATEGSDANGNTWSNVINENVSASAVEITDNQGAQTGIAVNVVSSFKKNGIRNGGLLVSDFSLLGDFAINTVTQDYFFAESTPAEILLSGLDSQKGYVFSFFGTRENESVRKTEYNLKGLNISVDTLQTSGTAIGADNYNGNNQTIVVSDTVMADVSGQISLTVKTLEGGFAYLSAMKIEEVEPIALSGDEYQTSYIDLGPSDGTNGNSTVGTDVNGNLWNNLVDESASASLVSLIDYKGYPTGIIVGVTSDFSKNGINHGGLLSPDINLLDFFAINTVTQDYFFAESTPAQLSISGLDVNKGYVFSMFGTRENTSVRKTEYTVLGLNVEVDTLQTSGSDIGSGGYDGNNQNIVITDTVMPDANGEIFLTVTSIEGGFSYLAGLKIDEVEPIVLVGAEYKTVYLDFGPDDSSNGDATLGIDNNGNRWNNIINESTSASTVSLLDNAGYAANINVDVISGFMKNGKQNGGLLSSDVNLLSDFAVNTVTQDYFFTQSSPGRLLISGLDAQKGYVFSMFGTRESSSLRETEYSVQGLNIDVDTLQTSGTSMGHDGYDGNNQLVIVSDTVMADIDGQIYLTVSTITGGFSYIGALKINEVPAIIVEDTFALCKDRDPYSIAIMGSSVANGTGATNSHGYAYLYDELLNNRSSNGGLPWGMTNISIGGNSTVNVLDRWETDLLPLCHKYVVYGLSLGNEGITTGGQAMFNQFRDNLLLLIQKSRAEGMEPIIVNCYTRGDYNATDYDYVKEMNLLIHSWDVASINVLGAVDDETGKWVSEYENDTYHPNDAGHQEFMYSIVPSLFDALDANKPQPEIVSDTYVHLNPEDVDYMLQFTAEELLHSFTFSFDIITNSSGPLATIETQLNEYSLSVDAQGTLNYFRNADSRISGNTVLNDSVWHKISLTHYYAKGITHLYVDDVLQGSVDERIEASVFSIGDANAPDANYKNLLFYRSALNTEEVSALEAGNLLKSSLEIYSPLDEKGVYSNDTLVNLAQSENRIIKVKLDTGASAVEELLSDNVRVYPSPADGFLIIDTKDQLLNVKILNLAGECVKILENGDQKIDISSLASGIFIVEVNGKNLRTVHKIIKI